MSSRKYTVCGIRKMSAASINFGGFKMKRFISLILVAIMCVGCVAVSASCTSDDGNTLVMATNAAFPPYEYVENGNYAGIDVEIAQAIAEKLGMTLKIADVDFGAIIGGVESGKYDIGMAGITVTDERKEQVSFSNTYATGIQVMIVKTDSDITGLNDLFNFDDDGNPVSLKNTNIKIGVQQDTTGDAYCSDAIAKWGFNDCNSDGEILINRVTRYKTGADAVEALKTGKVDMVIIDNEPAKSYVEANEGKIKIIESEEYAVEDYAIAVNKNDTALLQDINEALNELKADGTIDRIISKYINAGDTSNDDAA